MDNWVYTYREEKNGIGDRRWVVLAHIPMSVPERWVGAFDSEEEAVAYVLLNSWEQVNG